MKHFFYFLLLAVCPTVCFGQITPPALGAASSFALFTAVGAFDNVGPSIVYGDIGTNVGAFSGFPLGVVFGARHIGDTFSTQAATDVQTAYGQAETIPCAVPLAFLGGGQVLTPNAYCLGGQTTFAGELILDAQNDPNAIFFIRVSGAMTTGAGSVVTLINGANRDNVYWQVGGRVDLGSNSLFQGTLLVDGAINLIEGARLFGRALSREGAITMDTNLVNVPEATVTNWLGSASGTLANRQDWFRAANWSNGVPTATLNATILSGRPSYPVIAVGTATAFNLLLGNGAALTQSGGTLELRGDFSNGGTLTATGGTFALLGGLGHQVGGSSTSAFWNLAVGLEGATLTGPTQIKRVLTLTGNLDPAGKPLALVANPSGTAMIVNAGGAVTGTATVQCYLSATASNAVGYRHLASPVQNTTIGDLATVGFVPKVNPAYNAIPAPPLSAAQFPNIYAFDETRGGAGNQQFLTGYVSPNSTEDGMQNGRGYSVSIKGGLTPDFVGTPMTGDRTMTNLTRTGNGAKAGWHLLGNPYPSPLDWDLISVPLGMSNSVSVFKSTGAGSAGFYLTRAGNTGSLTNGEIALGQGFFVNVTGAGPVDFTIPNAARVTNYSAPAHFRAAPETRPLLALTLRATTAAADEVDEATVYFQTGATAALDAQFDGEKPAHNVGVPTLVSLTAQGQELAVNGLPTTTLAAGITIPLLLDLPTAGTYELAATKLLSLAGHDVTLFDRLTGTRYALDTQPRVTFTVAQAGETRTRFELHTGSRVLNTAAAVTAANFAAYPNPLQGDAQLTLVVPGVAAGQSVAAAIYNQLGQRVWAATLAAEAAGVQQRVAPHLARGIYTVQLVLPTGTRHSQRLVVE